MTHHGLSTDHSKNILALEAVDEEVSPSLRWFHWLVVAMSLVVAVGASYLSQRHVDERFRQDFDRQSSQVVKLVSERLTKYEDGLWAGVAAIQANGGTLSPEQWMTFENHFTIDEKYPGILGIGVIYPVALGQRESFVAEQRQTRPHFNIYPPHDQPELFPITLVEPLAANAKAVGLDMAHESHRYDGVKRARDTGQAQITGPIVLVQDSGQTPGFLFYAPYYLAAPGQDTQPRATRLLGLVYAPFVVKNLMEGTLGQSQRQVAIRIRDGESVLYDENFDARQNADNPRFIRTISLQLYGRTWRFDVFSTPELVAAHASTEPLIILLSGLSIDVLLFSLFIFLAKSNQRAQRLAVKMTAECRHRTIALERSNEELEKFAYIASHDLRAPLRAIDQLAEIVLEDAADKLPTQSREDLELLKSRVDRMDKLLTGLLDYSRIGSLAREPHELDVIKIIQDIIETQDLAMNISIEYSRPMASIHAPKAAAEIIFANLISNTLKHHDKPFANVNISYEYANGYDITTYTDDGPGIPYEYRDKVFQMFQTLRPRDEVEGSGMGLALVQKSLIAHGGQIELVEREGRGASFRIYWLRPIDQRLRAA